MPWLAGGSKEEGWKRKKLKEQPEVLEFQVTIGSLLKVVDYVVEYH
jgi:hypothetical protein